MGNKLSSNPISSDLDLTAALNEYKCAIHGAHDPDLILAFAQQFLEYAEEAWRVAQKHEIDVLKGSELDQILMVLEALDQDTPETYSYVKEAFRGSSIFVFDDSASSLLQHRVQVLLRRISDRAESDKQKDVTNIEATPKQKPYLTARFDLGVALHQFSNACIYGRDTNNILSMAHDLLSYAEFMWFKGVKTGHFSSEEASKKVFRIFESIKTKIPEEFEFIREVAKGAELEEPQIPTDSMFGHRASELVHDIRHRERMDMKFFMAASSDSAKKERIDRLLPRLKHSDSQSVLALEDKSERRIVPEQDVEARRLQRQARVPFLGNGEVLQVPFPLAHPTQSQNNPPPAMLPTNG